MRLFVWGPYAPMLPTEMIATAKAERDFPVCDYSDFSPALSTLHVLNCCAPCHGFSTTTFSPVGLYTEGPWVRNKSFFADIFPFRIVIQTLTVGALFV